MLAFLDGNGCLGRLFIVAHRRKRDRGCAGARHRPGHDRLGVIASWPPRLLASDANPVNLSESIEPL